ncbi:hypothetical protein [Saccharothrix xinjiangensis]|uniref:NTF2-like N-terminal transpeptidase domain-containing protein n=1 Tax=Saccharothrix xinjiangensis TaxID=204798 RepID=A0ABV9Y9I2_9PSEU
MTRKRLLVGWSVGLFAVAVVAGWSLVSSHNEDVPVTAVREYVEAIARGDATRANGLVDPGTGDRTALLTDEVLSSARQRLVVGDVRTTSPQPWGEVVEVEVDWRLSEPGFSSTRLRVQRTGAEFGVLDTWRVLDPLLASVVVETNEPRTSTARIGPATVPVGAPGHLRAVPAYPAVYEVRGIGSRYLAAEPTEVSARPDQPSRGQEFSRGRLEYTTTEALRAELDTRISEHLATCLSAADVGADCPHFVRNAASAGTRPVVLRPPALDDEQDHVGLIGDSLLDRPSPVPAVEFQAVGGPATYAYYEEQRQVTARVTGIAFIGANDALTVTFGHR